MKLLQNNSTILLKTILFYCLSLAVTLPTFANNGTPYSIFDKMNYQDVLDITLEVDMQALLEDRRSQEDYKATLKFTDDKGEEQTWNTEVKLRGKFRRMKCTEMPPLKLKFKKGDLAAVGLSSSNDMKMVTHCIEERQVAKELILKEYLAYKLYNQITDESFRVQLLNVTYKDINTGEKTKQWAFLIEDTAQLRSRLGAEKFKEAVADEAAFDKNQTKTMAVFEYMIGNADWKAITGKNAKIIRKGDKLMAIPYDFDFSGLVNAPYATANSNYHLTSKQDRVYLGFEDDLTDIEPTFNLFLQKQEQLIATVKDFKVLNASSRREIISYLETFFEAGANFKTKDSYLSDTGVETATK